MIRRRILLLVGVVVVAMYVGSYAVLYANRSSTNLIYFDYLKNGDEREGAERALYYFYYPVYKVHRLMGGATHDFDRPKLVEGPEWQATREFPLLAC